MTKKEELEYEVTTGNIFEALGLDQPEEVLVRAKLLEQVVDLVERSGLNQKEIAKILEITQSKVSKLINGRLSEFSADTLMHYLAKVGCVIEIHVKPPRPRSKSFGKLGRVTVMKKGPKRKAKSTSSSHKPQAQIAAKSGR